MSSTGVSSPPGTGAVTEPEFGAPRSTVSPEQIRDDLIDAAAGLAPEIGELVRPPSPVP